MRILIVSDAYPEHDRNSADYRLTQFIRALLAHGEVSFLALGPERQTDRIGTEIISRYQRDLTSHGVQVVTGGLKAALTTTAADVVVLEWYYCAMPYIAEIRAARPACRIITDSVDVVFNRLLAKARVSGLVSDQQHAEEVRAQELETYRLSDMVITVSDQDADILRSHAPGIRTFTIPNIHPLQDAKVSRSVDAKTLVFVGSKSQANDDAMNYFCQEVFPLILAKEPSAILRIIGTVQLPHLDVRVSGSIEQLGFVADTRPFLETSIISVAPLRFGGGMKGKVGEAMSMGLAVVATTTGAEGFQLQPGRDALVEDDAQGFADAVLSLLADPGRRAEVAESGKRFIAENYSDVAVRRRIDALVEQIRTIKPKSLPFSLRGRLVLQQLWDRHVSWRLR